MTLGIEFSVYTHLRLWGFMIKPSPAGEGWARGNQNKEKAYFYPPHPCLLTQGEGGTYSKVKQHQTLVAPHTLITIT